MNLWLGLVILVQAWWLTGCSTCSQGESHCNGNTTEVCSPGDSFTGWVIGQTCEYNQYCAVLSSSGATCVDSPGPVPECADAAIGGPAACLNNALTYCRDGYIVATTSCSGTCVETDASCVFCDEGSYVPDPACATGGSICFEGGLFECSCGGRIGTGEDCAGAVTPGPDIDGGVCVTGSSASGPESFCAASSQPDERCAGGVAGFCSAAEQISFTCRDGFVIGSVPCAECNPNSTCREVPGVASVQALGDP